MPNQMSSSEFAFIKAIDKVRAKNSVESFLLAFVTPTELRVWKCLADGASSKDIARSMDVSIRTVEKHRANLYSKFDTHGLSDLILLAVKFGLVSVGPVLKLDDELEVQPLPKIEGNHYTLVHRLLHSCHPVRS